MAIWLSNGADTGGSGSYVAGTQGVQYIHDTFAGTGDTISIPSGTFTWSTGISLTKSVTVSGTGYTVNTATFCSNPGALTGTLATTVKMNGNSNPTNLIHITSATTGTAICRITGINFTSMAPDGNHIYVRTDGTTSTDYFRLDNCYFNSTGVNCVSIQCFGNGPGLIDHSTFLIGLNGDHIHNNGTGPSGTSGWLDDVTPGSKFMLFMEDNMFSQDNSSTGTNMGSTSLIQGYYSARDVVRYNYMNYVKFDHHGNVQVNARWLEAYGNQQFITSLNTATIYFCTFRGGSGVIYNNTVATGSQSGTYNIQLWTDESAPPSNLSPAIAEPNGGPAYGPGSGIFTNPGGVVTSQSSSSSPLYIWGHSASFFVGQITGNNGWNPLVAGTNYKVSSTQPSSMIISQTAAQIPPTTYNYTPYTYPHPLTGLIIVPGNGVSAAADSTLVNTIIGKSGGYTSPANTYFACYNSEFSNSSKAGATEWTTTSNPAYARVPMGASGAGWTVAAYVNGTGVSWSNTNAVFQPPVQTNSQTLWSLGFCDALTAGNVDFFVDLNDAMTIAVGFCVLLPASTGVVLTLY